MLQFSNYARYHHFRIDIDGVLCQFDYILEFNFAEDSIWTLHIRDFVSHDPMDNENMFPEAIKVMIHRCESVDE
jgi:hypothetical protein